MISDRVLKPHKRDKMRLDKTPDWVVLPGLIKIKDGSWLSRQRVAGKVVSQALSMLEKLVREKTTKSLLELNAIAEAFILDHNCQCTFKNYRGFPAGVCISVNYQLVHGIPTSYQLQDGDIVSFDLGATYEGSIADSALTCIYGTARKIEHIKLIEATKEALHRGIVQARAGNRLGAIGNAIYKSARGNGFNVIENYGGHGICNHSDGSGMPHAPPFVSNRADSSVGIHLQAGMTLAIEPMLVPSDTSTQVGPNGWDIMTKEIGAHEEHTIFIHDDWIEVITEREKANV